MCELHGVLTTVLFLFRFFGRILSTISFFRPMVCIPRPIDLPNFGENVYVFTWAERAQRIERHRNKQMTSVELVAQKKAKANKSKRLNSQFKTIWYNFGNLYVIASIETSCDRFRGSGWHLPKAIKPKAFVLDREFIHEFVFRREKRRKKQNLLAAFRLVSSRFLCAIPNAFGWFHFAQISIRWWISFIEKCWEPCECIWHWMSSYLRNAKISASIRFPLNVIMLMNENCIYIFGCCCVHSFFSAVKFLSALRQSLDTFPWDYKKNKWTFFSLSLISYSFLVSIVILFNEIHRFGTIHRYLHGCVSFGRCDSLNRSVLYCDQWTIPMFIHLLIYIFFASISCFRVYVCNKYVSVYHHTKKIYKNKIVWWMKEIIDERQNERQQRRQLSRCVMCQGNSAFQLNH